MHGLDRSRHRLVSEETGGRRAVMLELDRHGRGDPQLLGAVMAAAGLAPSARDAALRAIDRAIAAPGLLPPGFEVRRLFEGVPEDRPPLAGEAGARRGAAATDDWRGIASERRWAMEALGLRPGMALEIGRAHV